MKSLRGLSPSEVLEAAGTVLLIPGAWTQGCFFRNDQGENGYHYGFGNIVSYCAQGAIQAVDAKNKIKAQATRALQLKIQDAEISIVCWNDESDQTAENIASTMFELAAELREKNNEKIKTP